MSLLSVEDFKGCPMDPNLSPFEALLEVARVASLKLQQETAANSTQNNLPDNPNPKSTSLKRSHANLFDEQDWVLDLQEEGKKKKKKKQHQVTPHHHDQGPDSESDTPMGLPEDFKKKIGEMGGSEVSLLIQKSLYCTDLSPQHNRLSLPMNQIKKTDFLREWESQLLKEKEKKGKCQALDVVLVEPSLRMRNIVLGKWDMSKSSCYMLRSSWMKVANENGLTVNDVIQVWSFRVQQQLCMALVKLTP